MIADIFEDSILNQWGRLTLPGLPAPPPLNSLERRHREKANKQREETTNEMVALVQKLQREVARERITLATIRRLPRGF